MYQNLFLKFTEKQFYDRLRSNSNFTNNEDYEEKFKKELSLRANLLDCLLHGASNLSYIEAEFNEPGKNIVRDISRKTNFWFILFFIFQIVPYFFNNDWSYFKYLVFTTIALPIIFVLIHFAIRIIVRLNIKKATKNQSEIGIIKDLIRGEIKIIGYKALVTKSIMFAPFAIRFIWWWTLIIGIVNLQFNTLEHIKDGKGIYRSNSFDLYEYSSDLLKILIISIIAFIATNVIRELLSLKRHYDNSANIVKNANTSFENISVLLKTANKNANNTLLYSNLMLLNDVKVEQKRVRDVLSNFSYLISDYAIDMSKTVTETAKDDMKMALSSTCKSILNGQLTSMSNRKDILLSFSNFGVLALELVENFKNIDDRDNYEFYALQLKTPDGFINKYFEDDKDWMKFINLNLKYNKVYRTFVKINFAYSDFKEECQDYLIEMPQDFLPNEYREIKNYSFEEKLNNKDKKYRVQSNKVINDTSDTKLGEVIFIEKLLENEGEYTLAELLENKIHPRNEGSGCSVREFDIKDFIELLHDFDYNYEYPKAGMKSNSNKLFDYFAIRRKNNNGEFDWAYCIRAVYDRSMEIAKFEIFQEPNKTDDETEKSSAVQDNTQNLPSDWEEIKCKLNRLFICKHKKCEMKNKICNNESYLNSNKFTNCFELEKKRVLKPLMHYVLGPNYSA